MIKLLKMINLYGFWRVMKDSEYYHRKYDGKSTKGYLTSEQRKYRTGIKL